MDTLEIRDCSFYCYAKLKSSNYRADKMEQLLFPYHLKSKFKSAGLECAGRQMCQVSPWHTTVGLQWAH